MPACKPRFGGVARRPSSRIPVGRVTPDACGTGSDDRVRRSLDRGNRGCEAGQPRTDGRLFRKNLLSADATNFETLSYIYDNKTT
jgi:hypothetical protein